MTSWVIILSITLGVNSQESEMFCFKSQRKDLWFIWVFEFFSGWSESDSNLRGHRVHLGISDSKNFPEMMIEKVRRSIRCSSTKTKHDISCPTTWLLAGERYQDYLYSTV